jgi:hypothetical protein
MKKRILDWVTKSFKLTIIEWGCLLGAALLLCCYLPIHLWHKGLIFLGNIIILYLLLIISKASREQDKEEELVNSIENYLCRYLEDEDLQSTSHPVDMVIEELWNWRSLPQEIKYKRDNP